MDSNMEEQQGVEGSDWSNLNNHNSENITENNLIEVIHHCTSLPVDTVVKDWEVE